MSQFFEWRRLYSDRLKKKKGNTFMIIIVSFRGLIFFKQLYLTDEAA